MITIEIGSNLAQTLIGVALIAAIAAVIRGR